MEPITDIEAERRVISSMLHSDTSCIYTLSKLDDSDFYNPINRDVYLLKALKGKQYPANASRDIQRSCKNRLHYRYKADRGN